jgi:predicted secreted hydrolase
VSPHRRAWLRQLAARALALGGVALSAQAAQGAASDSQANADPVRRGRPLQFPRDHGAHPGSRTEWWYATGWLGAGDAATALPQLGFQLTFFRSRTGLGEDSSSRFAARQLLFAHAAVTELAPGATRHRHAQRITRWNGQPGSAAGQASVTDAAVHIGNWRLKREPGAGALDARWRAELPASDFGLALELRRTQPPLLQGDSGFSRKGPDEVQASHYYSEPQLAARGSVTLDGRVRTLSGRAWLDHEWSDQILHPEATGWDWIGFNLLDGSALTAFVLRRRDGTALWAGGSYRRAGEAGASFTPDAVRFTPQRWWTSPATQARYPVEWLIDSPAGRHTVRALLDAQELDASGSTGTVYWEGLSELRDARGTRVGLGYLEMTGYSGALRL